MLAGLLPRIRDIRRIGAASIDLCLAAEGALDAYYEKGLNPWDSAAGGLVATEAGLLVTGLDGAPPGPDLVLAAPPAHPRALHDELVASTPPAALRRSPLRRWRRRCPGAGRGSPAGRATAAAR